MQPLQSDQIQHDASSHIDLQDLLKVRNKVKRMSCAALHALLNFVLHAQAMLHIQWNKAMRLLDSTFLHSASCTCMQRVLADQTGQVTKACLSAFEVQDLLQGTPDDALEIVHACQHSLAYICQQLA